MDADPLKTNEETGTNDDVSFPEDPYGEKIFDDDGTSENEDFSERKNDE